MESGDGSEPNVWPGYVDVLSNLVLVLLFVLVIFVFALMIASQKVEKKMAEVASSQKAQESSQAQLNKAIAELAQLHAEGANPNNEQSCFRFNKSDSTQKAEIAPDALSILINFTDGAISVTDDTAKSVLAFLDGIKANNNGTVSKIIIEASEDPTAPLPLQARETQLGRFLNVRNTVLSDKIDPKQISIRQTLAAQQQNNSYNWVKIYVEK